MQKETINISVKDVSLSLSVIRKEGAKPPVVFLHGFGSTKEEYTEFLNLPRNKGRAFLSFDAPGFGETKCDDLSRLSIPFLRQTTKAVVDHYGMQRFHLVGHSMGGLTGLVFAHANPGSVLSFTSIEGNVAPEDCFLSRKIIDFPEQDGNALLGHLADMMRESSDPAGEQYAKNLAKNTAAKAVAPIFRSMVHLSDTKPLMEYFLGLPMPKMFVHGDVNRSLSYLGHLKENGAQVAEIPKSGHFPMYSNPSALWQALSDFIEGVENE